MPIYSYNAKRGPAETVSGEMEAASPEAVIIRLEEMGLVPVKVSERGSPAGKGKAPGSQVKVRSGDLDTFTRQLASLVRSSIPIIQALTLLSKQTESKALKAVVADMAGKIKDGKMLSESMEVYPRIFNNMYLSMIRAGERSGTLDEVLRRMSEYREREQEIREKIRAALAYPILVMVVGAGTIFAMLVYFLPKLTVIFKGMKQALPLPTRILMGMSAFMSAYWYVFLIALGVLFAVFGRIGRGSKRKAALDMIKMRLPFLQKFTRNAEIAKFSRSLSMLLKNGLPIHESLELASASLDNEAMKISIGQASRDIIDHGHSLTESFTRTKIFPDFTINMISVGEESGRVAEALEEIADVYERETEQSIKIMSSLIEPILILVVGAVVGFIVFAMLLPVFNIGLGAK